MPIINKYTGEPLDSIKYKERQEFHKNRIRQMRKGINNMPSKLKFTDSSKTKGKTLSEIQGIVDNIANNDIQFINDLNKGVKDAANAQREEKLNTFHIYKNAINSVLSTAELASGGYGIARGLAKIKGLNLANKLDKHQILMNGIGAVADAGQLLIAESPFDYIENSIELTGDAAGIVGGTNWFRNKPFFGRYGNAIDNTLDITGYGAASYDVGKFIYTTIDEQINK